MKRKLADDPSGNPDSPEDATDASRLTEPQRLFAAAIGQLLADQWRELHAPRGECRQMTSTMDPTPRDS
ncbi:MAG: hypothetical protein DWQ35_01395 [Planctomycetota bacterium]|nr:MAG: hypothetical protein DWQ35_01395 [Planctomycetota bacterium]